MAVPAVPPQYSALCEEPEERSLGKGNDRRTRGARWWDACRASRHQRRPWTPPAIAHAPAASVGCSINANTEQAPHGFAPSERAECSLTLVDVVPTTVTWSRPARWVRPSTWRRRFRSFG